GARHGYAPPDMPVYNREASERHWTEMLKLFDGVLKAKVAA
ncbi:MAG: dienelactone hydrolase family protein, partial [Proteobacteria bacterium]|nr:dienelactone hydrolase family protein [Pseudomonadota bacterium]